MSSLCSVVHYAQSGFKYQFQNFQHSKVRSNRDFVATHDRLPNSPEHRTGNMATCQPSGTPFIPAAEK